MANKSSPQFWTTSISDITPEDVFVRGYPIQSLIGKLPFSALVGLLIRGKIPTPGEAKMMDAILGSILDYALQKSGTIAARCVVSVNPQMTAGLAAGVLGAGEFALSPEDAGRFIIESFKQFKESGKSADQYAAEFVAELRSQKRRVPGFGHPVFRGVDPRAQRLKEIAMEQGVWGPMGDWYEAVHRAFKQAVGKPDLVINDVGMVAALLAEMGYTPPEMAGLALLSTFPGLIAHVSEELSSGSPLRIIPDGNVEYARDRRDLNADMQDLGWT
jgi:citryl-CoA lyase